MLDDRNNEKNLLPALWTIMCLSRWAWVRNIFPHFWHVIGCQELYIYKESTQKKSKKIGYIYRARKKIHIKYDFFGMHFVYVKLFHINYFVYHT